MVDDMSKKTNTDTDSKKVVVVTGGSSGIGKATVKKFCESGFVVYEISRNGQSGDGFTHITADVTDVDSVKNAFSLIESQQGKIDVLVNNAGFGISGATEFTSVEDAKRLFDVDFFGTFNAIKAVVPIMRKLKCGRIVNVSSVAAVIAIPFQSFYSAAKSAVNSLTLSLANELKPFNITVSAIMPGDIKTGFTDARKKSFDGDDVYDGRIARSVSVMEKDETNGMSPSFIANAVFIIATKKHVKPLYSAGAQYKLFCILAKILPARLTNKIVGSIYNK